MSRTRLVNDRIEQTLHAAAERLSESPDDIEVLRTASAELAAVFGGDSQTAAAVALRAYALAERQAGQAIEALKAMKKQIEERPRLAWVLSPAFPFGHNGGGRQMLYTARVGRDTSAVECTTLPDANGAEKPDVPAPLSLCFVDGSGAFYLGKVGIPPILPSEEHTALAASADTQWPEIGEVVVSDGMERRLVLFSRRAVAQRIAELLEAGDTVVVRSEGGIVSRVVRETAGATPIWLEFLEPDGPSLQDLVLPSWLRADWERDFRRLAAGQTFWVGLLGPTGTGKTEAVKRFAREAGRRAGKRAALIHLSIAHVGSAYYSETEREILRAFKRATKLAKEGCAVTILFDEVDSLLGDSRGRFEGSVDRRVRLTVQECSSELGDGVAVYATMNARADSWLPSPLARRFEEWREYPRPTRGQITRVAAFYAKPDALARLGVGPEEFGGRIADFLYSDRFVVGRVHFHSGHALDVRARDLHVCSPGKVKALVTGFCDEVLADGNGMALDPLWQRMEREFRAADLNSANVFEVTFLPRPVHEEVSQVEHVRPSGPRVASGK